jgi:RND family efflux transporter MFP subunit
MTMTFKIAFPRGSIILLALGLAGCQAEALPPERPRPVLGMTVEPTATEVLGPFTSTIEARYQTRLGFQAAGRMVARDVYIGDVVHAGQELAALDPTVAKFALARARADVMDAKAQLVNAQGVEERQRQLVGGGNTTRAALDNATAGRGTAQARLDQAEAALRSAEDQIGYTRLIASFDGVVTAWSAEVGQYVTNGQAVVTIARPDIREAVVDVPDDMVGRIDPTTVFVVRLQADPTIMTTATPREIGALADSATRTRRLRLTLKTPPEAFRLGTTTTVAVERHVAPRFRVPARAVLDDEGGHHVFILAQDGGGLTRRAVTVIGHEGDSALIGAGLAAGETIVTAGVHELRDGQKVAGLSNRPAMVTRITRGTP